MLYNSTSPIHIEGAAFVGGCMLHRLLYNHYIQKGAACSCGGQILNLSLVEVCATILPSPTYMGTIPYSLEENIPIHDVCMRSFFKNKLKYMDAVVATHHLQRVCTLVPPHIKVSAWVHWLLSRNKDGYSGCMGTAVATLFTKMGTLVAVTPPTTPPYKGSSSRMSGRPLIALITNLFLAPSGSTYQL